jgi:pimeloyl-ACP methyl ester carboxylesterase
MFGAVGVPRRHREAVAHRVVRLGRVLGPALSAVARRVPMNHLTASLVSHTGFVLPYARPHHLVPALREFLRHDFRWYFDLALAAAEHDRMDVSFVRCPTTVVGGRWDALTDPVDVAAFARDIPGARYVELPGSHFLPVEFPERLHELLHDVVARSALGAAAR